MDVFAQVLPFLFHVFVFAIEVGVGVYLVQKDNRAAGLAFGLAAMEFIFILNDLLRLHAG